MCISVLFTSIYSNILLYITVNTGTTKFIQLHNFAPILSSLSLSPSVSLSISLSERRVLSLDLLWCFCSFFCNEKSDLVWLTATFTDYSYIIYHRETERGWESESLSLPLRDLNVVFSHTHAHEKKSELHQAVDPKRRWTQHHKIE